MLHFRSTGTRLALSWIAAAAAVVFAAVPLLANPQGSARLPASGPWTSRDYVEAIFAVHNGAITLPRRGNPKTEAFFDRLIDRGNVDLLMASARPIEEKRRHILLILSATGEFRGRYGYAVSLGDDVENEFVQIQIFRLYLIDRLARLDLPEQPQGTGSDNAIATALSGTLDTLAETHIFTSGQRAALGMALASHYPAIQTKLGSADRQAITLRIEGVAAAEDDPALKAAFVEALAEARRGN